MIYKSRVAFLRVKVSIRHRLARILKLTRPITEIIGVCMKPGRLCVMLCKACILLVEVEGQERHRVSSSEDDHASYMTVDTCRHNGSLQ